MFTMVAAQTHSKPGDIKHNVKNHCAAIQRAAANGGNVIVFPELSLTGYEPALAAETAINANDPLLKPLQHSCNELEMTVIVGCPIESGESKPFLGSFVFSPNRVVSIYRKRFLHTGEGNHFLAGDEVVVHSTHGKQVGVAICADVNEPRHSHDAATAGANIYTAGVAMTPGGIAQAANSMATAARQHQMASLMANYASPTGGFEMAGCSGAWNEQGSLIAQAPPEGESLVFAMQAKSGWQGDVQAL